jgi:uncharacterized protein (TIGR03083 family)
MIKEKRRTLVDALGKLSDADWDKPSLCRGWTVRDVVAHMVSTANMTPPKFLARLTGSRFSFQSMTRKEIVATQAGRSNAELVEALRARIDARTARPARRPRGWARRSCTARTCSAR